MTSTIAREPDAAGPAENGGCPAPAGTHVRVPKTCPHRSSDIFVFVDAVFSRAKT
jgi:hypothetical protein